MADAIRPSRRSVRSATRRRQRSVRVTVAVTLLTGATALVLLALPTRSATYIGAAAVVAMLLAWTALRIMWTEVLQSRREHAADRASTAHAYRTLVTERAVEHAEFTTAMTERLAQTTLQLREASGDADLQRRRAAEARAAAEATGERLARSQARVTELEHSLAELSDVEPDPVISLVARESAGHSERTA